MIYSCCDQNRRDLVAAHETLNGIDYLEVIDRDLPDHDPLRQRTLLVHCLKPVSAGFSRENVRILGGDRFKNVAVEWGTPASPAPAELTAPAPPDSAAAEAPTLAIVQALPDADRVLVVRTAAAGDYSTYTLELVASSIDDNPPPDFDPQLRRIDFGFKVECPSEFDCLPRRECPPELSAAPDIDYLAKDYASFRRLLLDRMAQLVPAWRQQSEADFGIAVVELLAYVADHLSYQQDAVATEAYLGTARRRVSLRRHALLVDYHVHDGCNARVWVHLEVEPESFALPLAGTQFLTRCPGAPNGLARNSRPLVEAMQARPEVFEPLLDPSLAPDYAQTLCRAHNEIKLYTWGDDRCCLPRGATRATLRGDLPNLRAGDALLFEEVLGPRTGERGDADPVHRHVVRLTSVKPVAPATRSDPVSGAAITQVEWADDDALPFALCISSVTDEAHGSRALHDVSVARGNLVLADHGGILRDDLGGAAQEDLGVVPAPRVLAAAETGADHCKAFVPLTIPERYGPQLGRGPLTQAAGRLVATANGEIGTAPEPFDPRAPASAAVRWSMADVLPQIAIEGRLGTTSRPWQPQRTLLNSASDALDFVVEVDDEGGSQIRFGDDARGERPEPGTAFSARYRVGNGAAGNVGADSIVHFVGAGGDLPNVVAVRNPLPARGGVDAEDAPSVRRNAPQAFRRQERAVTTEDYAAVAERDPRVQRAAASLRWTGSWYTVFLTPDPVAGTDAAALANALLGFVDRYRMAGHDLEVDEPRYVALEIDLHVCVAEEYFRSDVRQRLLQVLGNGTLADGRRGLFHPDNFSFSQSVHLSRVYAAAHDVPGVASVQVTRFQRRGLDDPKALAIGELRLGRLEIARLDNDRNFPERGILRLDVQGGR